jgi:hypothetical protein
MIHPEGHISLDPPPEVGEATGTSFGKEVGNSVAEGIFVLVGISVTAGIIGSTPVIETKLNRIRA